MDPAVVALLAAGIPASVAAITFAVAQRSRATNARKAREDNALLAVIEAAERVPIHLSWPWIVRIFTRPDLKLVFACTRLVAVLPKEDRALWEYALQAAGTLSHARGIERAAIASEISAAIVVRLRSAKDSRAHLKRIGPFTVDSPAEPT